MDAERKLHLLSLPPYLCFSLMRFVYDTETLERVKVSDSFVFPTALDMTRRVTPATEGGAELQSFELCAVLKHKGANATSGHYGAAVGGRAGMGGAHRDCK